MKTLLKAIRENNILLELVDGKLSIFAAESFLSPELIAEIEENKLALTQLLLDNTQNGVNDSFDPGIPVAPPSHDYPLSSTQRRLWVLSQFKDASIAYNIPGVYTFEGDLDQPALEYAFNSLIQRHEILRTIFKEDAEGEIRQFVNSPEKAGFRIDYYDLAAEKDQEEKSALLIRQEIARPFDLVKGPLLRVALCRLSENKWIFIYVMHHIISDGWSMGVLITELLSFYNGYTEGDTAMLPPLRIQYKDYAVWQKGWMEDDPLKEHKEYWLKKMEGELPVLELLSGPRPPVRTYNGDTLYKQFDPSITRAIRSLGHGQGGTLFMALTAAVSALLYRYTGQNDIIIGIPIAGRDHIDLEDQIGFYVNTLALRMQFKGEDSYQQLLE
ncbi:MAG TPA: condensation domain-containing protein, partial [Puia sp.]|nr:condensation domain-containing protein [Puia sp.]